MKLNQTNFILFIVFLLLLGCKDKKKENIKFEKVAWNTYGDAVACPPCRDQMLEDLVKNHKLKGITFSQLCELLGEPPKCETCEKNTVEYEIVVDYGHDIDPVYFKLLEFTLDKDSIIINWRIKEIKN
jgi:hypothetical protein